MAFNSYYLSEILGCKRSFGHGFPHSAHPLLSWKNLPALSRTPLLSLSLTSASSSRAPCCHRYLLPPLKPTTPSPPSLRATRLPSLFPKPAPSRCLAAAAATAALPILMAGRRTCWGALDRPRPSQGAPTSTLGTGGARAPPALTLTTGINRPQSLLLCCKRMFQLFQRYVASVSYECCKSKLGCCICCNGYTCMLQVSVSNVSSVFSYECCNWFYLDVAYVSHICCSFYLDVTYVLQWLSSVFGVFVSVLDTCFNCFTCERIKMPKRGVNWAFLKINCKN
jgi:hypothetical protein